MRPVLPRPAGLSLIELLVVLAILALLGAMAVPSWRAMQARAAVDASANALLLALHRARAAALAEGVAVELRLTSPGAGYRAGRAGAAPLLEVALPRGLRLSATRAVVTYWPWPRAGSTTTFTLCDPAVPSATRQVVVSQTGRPRVQRTSGVGCP